MRRVLLRSCEIGLFSVLCATGTGLAWAQTTSGSAHGTFVGATEALKAYSSGGIVPLSQAAFPGAGGTVSTEYASDPPANSAPGTTLPLWSFNVLASRDGKNHRGVAVGTNPFTYPGTASVPVEIIPVKFVLQSIATAFNPATFVFMTQAGSATVDPTEQRASFYNANREVAESYHLLLQPDVVEPITIRVPAYAGLAIPAGSQVLSIFGFIPCSTVAIVDFLWFDTYLNDVLLPHLAGEGVNPTNLPYFMIYNSWLAQPPTFLGSCCILGYHSFGFAGRSPQLPSQTYSVADFDTTGLFGPGGFDTAVAAHEIGEWANDPFGINYVPAWGGTGQVRGCQNNLEVGDPLTGTNMPTVKGKNGFTYHLQELAFFSWFFGAPSVGANGWFSGNGTFRTDAGMPCDLF